MNAQTTFRALAAVAAAMFLMIASVARADDNPVAVRAVPQYPAVEQGGRLVIAVEMDHQEHYHTWPAKEVKLADAIDEFAIRTEIGLAKDKDDKLVIPSWIAKFDGIQYPVAHPGKVADPTGAKPTIEVPLYAGKAISYVRLEVKPDASLGEQTVNLVVSYQSCNEQTCTPPQELVIPVKVRVVAKGTAELGAANEPGLFEKFDGKKWGAGGEATTPGVKPTEKPIEKPVAKPIEKPAVPAPNLPAKQSAAGGGVLFGMDLGSNIFVLFLAAAIGGFVLNLTPCVLPVIPIKVLTISKHASSKGHALVLGLWMALGVVAFWTVIGFPMAFISRQLDPAQFIFGYWIITFGIGLVVAILGLGIMGLFTLNLPQSVYSIETKADGPSGSFMFGVMTAVLGLPCFGFVAGGLLAAAATMPPLTIMAIFVGLGVGMASPYLVLAVYPDLLKFLPRTGPASELVKQVMGILLLAAAAYFITCGIQALLLERPYLSGSMTWWAVGFFVAVAGLWLAIRTLQIAKTPWPKVAMPMLALVMTAGIGLFAQNRLSADHANYIERQQAMAQFNGTGAAGSGQVPPGVWLEYTPELFAAVRATGKPVFLDFTANWCITCKALKAALLDREPLKSEFKQRGIVLMEVDCTVHSSVGSQKLKDLGRTGVPTWVIYPAGSDSPRFVPVDTPTSGTVLAELDAAGITAAAATAQAPATVVNQAAKAGR